MARINHLLKILPQVTVATAGTAVPLSALELKVASVVVQWDPSNTGDIYIGESDVTGTKCIKLNSGNPVIEITVDDTAADEDMSVVDLAEIFVDAQVNGDKVNVAYLALNCVDYNS